jgi:hypothetical protein
MVLVVLKLISQIYTHGLRFIFQVLDGLDLIVQVDYLQEKDIFPLLVHHTITVLMLLRDLVINVKQNLNLTTVLQEFLNPQGLQNHIKKSNGKLFMI